MGVPLHDLRHRILQLLRQPKYQPLDKVELSKALRIDSSERRSVRDVLDALEREGLIARIRKDRYVLPAAADLATGILQVHQNGSAHLVNEKRDLPEIHLSAQNTGVALHHDKVVVQLVHEGRKQPRDLGARLEGRVIRILERANTTVVGTLRTTAKGFLYVLPDDARIPHDVYVHPGAAKLPVAPAPGDKVVVKLDPWEDRRGNPEGEIVERLGPADAPGVDLLSIVRKYGLPLEFPAAVLAEAERIPEEIDPREAARREDLRGKTIFTIDPDDARDFDDAIDVEVTKVGWRLGVHIADVSHYVRPGTALDREAQKRGNSTYLADRVIPMLPERLSNGVCSLKPGVDRLTFSVFIDVTKTGQIKAMRFARTVIRSAGRFSYRQALAMLQGADSMPPLPPAMKKEELRGLATIASGPPVPVDPAVAERVREAWRLASVLRESRFAAGSLDLDFPEVKVWLDEDGRAVRLEKVENDVSHQLIEECMLAANESVAREIKQRRTASVYRIHEDPDPEKLVAFRDVAAAYGFRAGNLTHRPEVQKLLAAIKGVAEEQALKIAFLKSLKRATYDTTPKGHYGLAKVNYTHFTSPIRRYADLIVHRSLADIVSPPKMGPDETRIKRAQPASVAQLEKLAVHVSETERISADAERDSVQLKKMEYFQRQLGERRAESFRALVVDVRSYGLFVELPSVSMSGLVHVSDLPDDFYVFDPVRLTFSGRRSRRVFKLGDELAVRVSRVDPHKRQIDFVLAPENPAPAGGRGSETLTNDRPVAPGSPRQDRPRREVSRPAPAGKGPRRRFSKP